MIKCAIHQTFLSCVTNVPKMAQKSRHHKILGNIFLKKKKKKNLFRTKPTRMGEEMKF